MDTHPIGIRSLLAVLLTAPLAAAAQLTPDFITILGGSANERVFAIATDQNGNTYVVGETASVDFPVVGGIQASRRGSFDAFVVKLARDGDVVWSTYLGGDGFDSGRGIAVDAGGNVWVTGYTDSLNFPLQNALDANRGGFSDAFIARLSPTGNALTFSTYFGGSDGDNAEAIAIDTDGRIYVAGRTRGGLTLVNPAQATLGGVEDAFVARLNAAATAYEHVTYLGGNATEITNAIAAGPAGRACIAGLSQSTVFPAVNPVQPGFGGGATDAFYAAIDTTAGTVEVASLMGGSGDDVIHGVDCDGQRLGVVGDTDSTDFPTGSTGTPVQIASGGGRDGFAVTVTIATGAREVASYSGGFRDERLVGIELAGDGSFSAAGDSSSSRVDMATAAPEAAATVGVHRSLDGGATWEAFGLPGLAINRLAVSPTDPRTLLAATDDGLYTSTDNGATWARQAAALVQRVVHDVTVDPFDPCVWVAGIESSPIDGASPVGAARTANCGASWAPWALPALRFRSVAFLPNGNRLVAQADRVATGGEGTPADTCLLDDTGALRTCLDQGSSTNVVVADPTAPCRFIIGNETGAVTTYEGTAIGGCDYPLSTLYSTATPTSRIRSLLAVPSPLPGIARQIAGAEDGRIVYRDGQGPWTTATTQNCAVSTLAALPAPGVVAAGGCPTIRAEGITELTGDVLVATTVSENTGATASRDVVGVNTDLFLGTNLTARPYFAASSELTEALLFLDDPGTCPREVTAVVSTVANYRVAANGRGKCGYDETDPRVGLRGTPGGVDVVVSGRGPATDVVFANGFEGPPID